MTPGDWIIVVLCFAGLIAGAVYLCKSLFRRRGSNCCGSGKSGKTVSAPKRADGSSLSDKYCDSCKTGSCNGNCSHCKGCH